MPCCSMNLKEHRKLETQTRKVNDQEAELRRCIDNCAAAEGDSNSYGQL